MLTGSVASVSAAIERASAEASVYGMFLDSTVIPNPDKKLWDMIL
jgi:microcompartment protein CcmL/EutN